MIIEGKTKKVFELPAEPKLCLLQSKDRITAGDGVKSHELEGKAKISTATNAKVFELLNQAGMKTAFVEVTDGISFLAKKCEMVPIEWVTRRLATGSFLKRNTGALKILNIYNDRDYEVLLKRSMSSNRLRMDLAVYFVKLKPCHYSLIY